MFLTRGLHVRQRWVKVLMSVGIIPPVEPTPDRASSGVNRRWKLGRKRSTAERGAGRELFQTVSNGSSAASRPNLARNVRYNSEVKFAIPETMFEWLSKPASGKASPPALHAEHQPVSNRRTP